MPYEIGSYNASTYQRPAQSQAFADPAWSWLAKQEFDVNRAWASQAANRRGTLQGGPTYERFLQFGNEQQWAVFKPRPVLTTPILPDEQQFYRRQLGAIEWDSIDPFNTVDQGADQFKQATGQDTLGFLKGASDFLASKQIDIMGMGSTGAPARAADYALAFPIAIMQKLTGQSSDALHPLPQDNIYYKFQADPRYWQTIAAATPEQLDAMAVATVRNYLDPAANGYFVEQLRNQFNRDREAMLGLSSGNPAVDYQAIKGTISGFSVGGGFPKIPIIGTQIAEFMDPITPAERDAWSKLDMKTRRDALGHYGMLQMGTDFIASMPALSGLGTVLAVAKGGGIVARSLAEGYDWTLRAGGWVASAGLTAAIANWTLEATVPGYSQVLGDAVDHARPISGSGLAAVVNTIGYWSTGTYGASNLIRAGVKAAGLAAEANAAVRLGAAASRGLVEPSIGLPEMTIYSVGHGGALMDNRLVQAGLDPKLLELSKQRLIMSEVSHLTKQSTLDIWQAILKGEKSGRAEIDNLPTEDRLQAASADLVAAVEGDHHMAELAMRVLAADRQPAKLFRSDEALATHRWFKVQARTINDEIAKSYMAAYGPGWITRTAGAYSTDAMKTYVEGSLARVGGDMTQLKGVRGIDSWAQVMRSVHQYEFDYRNGELQHALEMPGIDGQPPREAGKLSVVSARHLFNDDAATAIATLRGSDAEAARAQVNHLIDHTIEGERWFSNDWSPPHGAARDRELVKPEQMARWLEDVQAALLVRCGKPNPTADTALLPLNKFHTRLANDGVWELAFKPVNEAGDNVSYVQTRDGHAFQTPWLDYPLGNADNIALGNAGMARAKYDSVFRGFRTWRVAEFQRASLYRSLTGRFNFTASQVDSFHAGLLQIARRFSVQPQTLGTVSHGLAGMGSAMPEAVEKLARDVFGEGPYLARDGSKIAIDWRKEIAQSYRQSLRLNFTAGLTSQMKSRFGPVGSSAAWFSDIGYVNLRFNLSPLFKIGEVVESKMYNWMAGVNPGGDPWVEALMYRAGLGNDVGAMAQELAYDQTLQGLNPLAGKARNPAQARQAAAYAFYARQAPETFAQKAENASRQARVDAFQSFVQGGNSIYASPRHALEVELANMVDDAGNITPGNEGRADEITKILTGQLRLDEVNALHHVSQELPDETWSTDPMDLGGAGVPAWVDETMRPEDRGMWHATTNVDGVMAQGLMSRAERVARGDRAVGLGAMSPDVNVSVTTDYNHVSLIAARLRLAAEAARNTATGREIVDAFDAAYEDAYGPVNGPARMFGAIGGTPMDVGGGAGPSPSHVPGEFPPDYLAAVIDHAFTGEGKYAVVQKLDAELFPAHAYADQHPDVLAVGLAGKWEDMVLVDPANIGIVQVGIKKGTNWSYGADLNEVRIKSSDVWTLDQRILDQPLADDREGLLAQLKGTVREDGTVIPGFADYHDAITQKLEQLDRADMPPPEIVNGQPMDTVNQIEDVFGTPEHLTKVIDDQGDKAWQRRSVYDTGGTNVARRLWEEIKNPVPGKQQQAALLQIETLRREFPILVEAALGKNSGLAEVLGKELGIPNRDWLPFLMRDRELATTFHNSGKPEDLQALMDFAGGPAEQGKFDELYASEQWQALTGMFAIAARTASDEAFRVHFFNPYRSAIERSLNHPLLGVYPLSWAYKAAREWARFLFENRTFGELRLGMAPAVALNAVVRAENIAFAQSEPQSLEQYIGTKGPFGSTFLIFNLLLPGDWSTIPFPMSRTIRDALRGNLNAQTLENNIGSLGAARDARMGFEMAGELKDFVWGPDVKDPGANPPPWRPHPNVPPTKQSTLQIDTFR